MYKLIAIDLDGTLLNSYGEITDGNREAIKYALNKNIEVVLASGRDPQTMKKISQDLGINNYLIAGNGASIYDIKQERNIYENFIDKEKALRIIRMCKENSIFFNLYTDKGIITESLNFNVKVFNSENNHKATEKQTNIEIVKDVYEYTKDNEMNILKIIICDNSKIIFNNIMQKLKNIKGIEVLDVEHMSKKIIKIGIEEFEIQYYYTEISSKNVDKWYAIEYLTQILGIKAEEIIAIGDNINDKKMIEKSAVGIVMKNSALAAQNIGDFITEDNNSNGIEKAIYQYI